ncbi:DUF2892 domain-containing protein [bacterium]|nr:DUF2892 domain-containing protein [bacterium]
MGKLDRYIRLILAAVIAVLYFNKNIDGTAAIVLGIIAIVFIITSAAGFCPLYVPFKIKTLKK